MDWTWITNNGLAVAILVAIGVGIRMLIVWITSPANPIFGEHGIIARVIASHLALIETIQESFVTHHSESRGHYIAAAMGCAKLVAITNAGREACDLLERIIPEERDAVERIRRCLDERTDLTRSPNES